LDDNSTADQGVNAGRRGPKTGRQKLSGKGRVGPQHQQQQTATEKTSS